MTILKKIMIFAAAALGAMPAMSDQLINPDPTVTCAGVPRWDRFVVNATDRQWDPAGGGCYLMPDGTVEWRAHDADAPLYGRHAGDQDADGDARALYGTYNADADFERGRDLYGTFDGRYVSSVPKPVRAAAVSKPAPVKKSAPKPIAAKTAATPKEKHPVKIAAVKPAPKGPAAPISDSVATTVPVVPNPVATPARQAAVRHIAAVNRGFNIDDYCTEHNPPVKGKLPDGLVLMNGAPDKMSCVIR